jgi:hypothetical protein
MTMGSTMCPSEDARDLLREFWGVGVRVYLGKDRFRLSPRGVADGKLRYALTAYAPDVAALLEQLPAPGRCPICGDPHDDTDKSQAHCVPCATIAARRMGLMPTLPAQDISKGVLNDAA